MVFVVQEGKGEPTLEYVTFSRLGEDWRKAKNEDFISFPEEVYLRILHDIKNILEVLFGDNVNDFFKQIQKAKGEITRYRHDEIPIRKVQMRKAALEFLKSLETSESADYVPQWRIGASKEISNEIRAIYSDGEVYINKYVPAVIALFKTKTGVVSHVNMGFFFHRLGLLSKRHSISQENQQMLQEFLPSLVERVENEIFTGQSIGNIFYGLQNLSDEVVSKEFVEAFIEKIKETSLNGQEIANTFYGLQNLSDKVVSKEFLEKLMKKKNDIDCSPEGDCHILYALLSFKNYVHESPILKQGIKNIWDNLETRLGEEENSVTIVSVRQIYSLYGYEFPQRYEGKYKNAAEELRKRPTSYAERESLKYIQNIYSGNVLHGAYRDGFEMDFYFPELNLNIEVDGEYHDAPVQQLHDKRRDEYLTRKRIIVVRVKGKDVKSIKAILEKYISA
jgi:very-short-patch-repair endonuclease